MDLTTAQRIHFIGVAGTGMSAIAQYLAGTGHRVSGSDREFGKPGAQKTEQQLINAGITCYAQDGTGISPDLAAVVVSTAIEDTVTEYKKAKDLGIPILHRADMLRAITETKRTIAVSGTSGKSTTSAMLFHILHHAGLSPSIISGAGLVSLQEEGKIGNAYAGTGDWLVIEADESDGTLVKYYPEVGVMLNLDKDHKEMEQLHDIFAAFRDHVQAALVVNRAHPATRLYSRSPQFDIGYTPDCGFMMQDFVQEPAAIRFTINGIPFHIPVLGRYNMENAAAAVAAAAIAGVTPAQSADALQHYKGIYRRMQLLTIAHGIPIYDDYAHNPVKIAAAISALQPLTTRVIAWFQPHGYGPTRFLKADFIHEISQVLRPEDQVWMSEIFYAGGTAVKDISANDLIEGIRSNGKNAVFVENRNDLPAALQSILQPGDILLLMGARDPSLESFAQYVCQSLSA
jgi:UDP-N-acetylmuramate--alanine ligase